MNQLKPQSLGNTILLSFDVIKREKKNVGFNSVELPGGPEDDDFVPGCAVRAIE